MRKIFISLSFICSTIYSFAAVERDFNIQIHVKGMENQQGILAYNYGDKKYIADTLKFDQKGIGFIKGKKTLDDGTYLVAFPSINLASFEFIIRETAFQLETDTFNLSENMKITNSYENKIMYEDLKKTIAISQKIDSLNKIVNDENLSDEVREKAETDKQELNKKFTQERIEAIEKHPNALYHKILNVLRDVPMSASPVNEKGDSVANYGYNYFIQHYWDNIDFNDVALIKSPVVLPRINRFYDAIYQHPDSLIRAVDILIEKSSVNNETFQIVTSEIINKFAKSKLMGHENVYVHLLDKYYLTGKTPWVDAETIGKMKERADALRPTLIGKIAPDITVFNLNNQPMNFYKSIEKNDYTVLVFWNSECSHCKKEIPELRNLFVDTLQKQYNIGVFGISTEIELEHINKFIDDNEIRNVFTNAYDPTGRSNFRKLYDIVSTPVVIVLDKNKRIIAKKINVSDIGLVIATNEEYLKNLQSSNNSSK